MVYVFGIEGVPVFEMLIVLILLMLIGLVFLMWQINSLRKIVATQKKSLDRFESDIASLEVNKQSMNLVEQYVRKAFLQGITEEQVKAKLSESGWQERDIEKIISDAK
jgi:RsiW-degrading membrane proteinase PrsW (M82 family)